MNSPHKYTVYDVAAKAGVSIATVSRVLNSPEQVRESTRLKVLNTIDELGFEPKADASARARKILGRIGVITPFFTFPSFIQRMRGIATVLADTPYEMVIYPVESLDRLDGYLASLTITRRVDGLILISLPLDDASAQRMQRHHLEAVIIEGCQANFSSVQIDDYHGGVLAAAYLLEQGHSRFAFLGPGELPAYSLHPEDRRLAGFQSALEQAGIELREEFVRFPALSHPDVHAEITHWMSLPEAPDAVFAASDDLAIRLWRAARELGLKVPDDLAIIGFDDIDMAEQVGLTTISQSLDESGRIAAELLLARLGNSDRPTQRLEIGLNVLPRETA
jgi:LacI family transcriptional regulator